MNSILFIGTGGCGNKLVNEFANVLNRTIGLKNVYDYKFINSNENEMNGLSHYNPLLNGIIINGGGTGRNQLEAKKSLSLERSKIINVFSSILHKYTSVYIVSSADGGFGSGSIDILVKAMKSIDENIKINIIAAMPKINSRKLGLENSIRFYENVVKLSESNTINSVQFIDNDKMFDEDDFNTEVVQSIIDSLEFDSGVIDSTDSALINSANGYKVILPLHDYKGTLSDAIDNAIKDSPFVIPNLLDCTHLGGVFVKDEYDKDEVLNLFDIRDIDKTAYGDSNIVVLGGCVMPDEHMELLQTALDDLEKTFAQNRTKSKFKSHLSDTTNNTQSSRLSRQSAPKKEVETNKRNKLRALLDDDSFWND